MQEDVCKTVNSDKEQNLNNKKVEFGISILFYTSNTFLSNSILFQGLRN